MSTNFIDRTSMRPFPMLGDMLGVNTTKASSSLPEFAKIKIPNPSVLIKVVYEYLSYVICFSAALYVNVAFILKVTSLISPQLPSACLWLYTLGCASLLFIGYLEKNSEEAWKVDLRERIALGMDEKTF